MRRHRFPLRGEAILQRIFRAVVEVTFHPSIVRAMSNAIDNFRQEIVTNGSGSSVPRKWYMNQKNDHVVIGNMEKRMKKEMLFLMASLLAAGNVLAQDPTYSAARLDEEGELAKQLANPLATLISVPFQYNYDENYGPNDDGSVSRLNIQSVIPFSMGEDWAVITRTIFPLID